MTQAKISLYSFAELSEQAKRKAISEHEDFLLSVGEESENEDGEMVTEYPEEIEESVVIEHIEINEYLFFEDGNLAHCVTYTGGHKKAGTTELFFHGQIIVL